MAPKSKRLSQGARAGIVFPVSRIHRYLKSSPTVTKRVSKAASVYLSATLEYLAAEILELSGNAARDYKRTRIIPRHILLSTASDLELNQLLNGCLIPGGGVLPKICPALFPVKGASSSDASNTGSSASQSTTPKKKNVNNQTKKPATQKATLKKAGQGSFTILGTPKSKAAALKGTAVTTLSERVLNRGQKLTVVQGNIINIQADAIVHPTSSSLSFGGEVGNALAKAGGQQLKEAVANASKTQTLNKTSDVCITDAPNLLASHLIHVNSPTWNAGSQTECISDLDQATTNILTLADQKGLTSVALPSISSGNAGFPKQTAAQTILAALSKYFRQTATTNLQQVFFVLYDAESVNVYTTELQRMVE